MRGSQPTNQQKEISGNSVSAEGSSIVEFPLKIPMRSMERRTIEESI